MSFKRFDAEDIVVSSDSITGPAWSTKNPALTNFFTSSIQKNGSSGDFYMSVYHVDPNTSASIAEVQFEIAYADNKGIGVGVGLNQDFNVVFSGKMYFKLGK